MLGRRGTGLRGRCEGRGARAGAGVSGRVAGAAAFEAFRSFSKRTCVPKMMLASSDTISPMTAATSFTSCNDIAELPAEGKRGGEGVRGEGQGSGGEGWIRIGLLGFG